MSNRQNDVNITNFISFVKSKNKSTSPRMLYINRLKYYMINDYEWKKSRLNDRFMHTQPLFCEEEKKMF